MKPLATALGDYAATAQLLLTTSDERSPVSRDEVAQEHGAAVAALLPDRISSEALARLSPAELADARARLSLCARCPAHGGECDRPDERDHGMRPEWSEADGIRLVRCERWKSYVVRQRLLQSGVRERFLDARFGTYEPKDKLQRHALERCRAYAESFDRARAPASLLISGSATGVGKTHLAVSVLATLIERRAIRSALFVYVPELLERIRRSFDAAPGDPDRSLLDRAIRSDLLVMDDLCAQRTTDWVREQVNLITNGRWDRKLATIVTSNAVRSEIATTIGERATSRLAGGVVGVYLDGKDHRRGAEEEW